MTDPRSATLLRAAVGEPPFVTPTPEDFGEWLELARAQRVIPLLHEVVRRSGGLTEAENATIEAAQIDVMGYAVRLEHELLEVGDVLEGADVQFAVLKGVATAHLDYPSPAMRQFGDVDLLVSPDDFSRACAILRSAGWETPYAIPQHHERFMHAITFRRPGRGEIDLHQRIAHRALGLLVPTDELLAAAVPLDIAGQRLRALCEVDRLIHAALHATASRGPYRRLSSTADVLVLAIRVRSAATVLDRSETWRLGSIIASVVGDASVMAEVPVGNAWHGLGTRRWRHTLLERAYLSNRRRPILEELLYLRVLPRWRDRRRYLSGYFDVGSDYAARKGRRDVSAQLRYLWSRLRSDE